jgi:hypothetical protein
MIASDIRRLLAAGALVIAVMAVSAGARADFLSGNDLYARCTSAFVTDQSFCNGYIAAITDASWDLKPNNIPGNVLGFRQCMPNEVTNRQATDIVKQFLAGHPAYRHASASFLAANALAEAFPCR